MQRVHRPCKSGGSDSKTHLTFILRHASQLLTRRLSEGSWELTLELELVAVIVASAMLAM